MADRLNFPRFVASWTAYGIGDGLHRIANALIDLSMRAQGLHGSRKWPWGEDDLWEPYSCEPVQLEQSE